MSDSYLDEAQDASEAWTMADLDTAGVAAVQARLRGGRMTDVTLDALESHLIKRGSVGGAWQMCLIAEVRRLQAELAEERLRVRALRASEADHARDRDTIERIIDALDGEQ